MEESPTIYEQIRTSGYSRRDFLKFCAWVTAFMGIEASGIGNVVRAMETNIACRLYGSIFRNVLAAVSLFFALHTR